MRALLILSVAASLLGCGQHSRNDHYQPPPNPIPVATDDGGDNGMPTIDPGGGPPDCSAAAKLVYVVDQGNQLSSFRPDNRLFIDIGMLNCPAQLGATPFSMAIDRTPAAWVLYSSGELFHVSVTDAKCTPTTFSGGTTFMNFGMGFVSNMKGSTDETLFIAGGGMAFAGTPATLAKIDTKTLALTQIGGLTGWPELTGTGDARLWGFFPDATSPRVAEINKTSGALSSLFPLKGLEGTPTAWAFAFWGGDFWIFLQRSSDLSTTVYRLRQATGTVQVILHDTGRHIVGAGVSTCAPISIG